ncbi:MAG: ASKHA domain-containing protein [Eubacteriales bacterium]
MGDTIINEEFEIKISRDTVLDLISCYEDSPVYEETIEEYEEVLPEVMAAFTPKSVYTFGEVASGEEVEGLLQLGEKLIYSIVTVGAEVSRISERYFAEGDYLKGMLVDAIADCAITSIQEQVRPLIKEECIKRNVGIARRYEAPTFIPMEYQNVAYVKTEAKKNLEMDITCGYMLNPVKSCCQILVISEDTTLFKLDHDCRHCPNVDCKSRNIIDTPITVINHEVMLCGYDENLLELLTKNNCYVSAPCGGKGMCGKCKIRVISGDLAETIYDKQFFTEEELQQGYRLACKAYPEEACTIEICQVSEERIQVLGVESSTQGKKQELEMQLSGEKLQYSVAVDIGTTTLALSLVAIRTGMVIDTYTGLNHQRAYGGDVISRMQSSNEGKGVELREVICKDLLSGIRELMSKNAVEAHEIVKVIISANTTMQHLLLGYSCETLGVVPFTPVNIERILLPFGEVFEGDNLLEAEVVFLPGISTFVGADIVAGMYECGMAKSQKYSMLIDLGTNGEMALGNDETILVTSTAMGPACEGGNISCGVGGIPGAICSVSIQGEEVQYETIGEREPIGLCGTGVLEVVAELRSNDWVDETGLLDDTHFDEGFPITEGVAGDKIVFTQKDIREIQLAKAAVRAGVETLIKKMNLEYKDVECVYLAGGFGFSLDKEKAVAIGMLPEELLDRVKTVGNTSLKGAIRYSCISDEEIGVLEHIVGISEEVSLSEDKYFNEQYVEQMLFE